MSEIMQTQILSVEPKQGQKGPFWVIKLGNGSSGSAFDQPVAHAATQYAGTPALVSVGIERKGQYTNIKSVAPFNGAAAPPPLNSGPVPLPMPEPDNKNERIGKMNAAGTAFQFASRLAENFNSVQELEEFAWELAKRIYDKTNGVSADIPVVAKTPDEAAAQVNEIMGGEVVKKGVDW